MTEKEMYNIRDVRLEILKIIYENIHTVSGLATSTELVILEAHKLEEYVLEGKVPKF